MNPRRQFLIAVLTVVGSAALAIVASRFGITLPPTLQPPTQPVVVQTVPTGLIFRRREPLFPVRPQLPAEPVVRSEGKLIVRNMMCTATVLSPRRKDGKWNILSAGHCVAGLPLGGKACFNVGDTCFPVSLAAVDNDADCAILVTDGEKLDFVASPLALKSPAVGTPVWHQGFGVDRPGNKEVGAYNGVNGAQSVFTLSVSHGDSGAAIFVGDEIVGCVSGTTLLGRRARMFGASVESIRKLVP